MIYSEEVFRQKVEYMHFNPVKRGLVREPEHWRYSSAASYTLGVKGELEIDDFGIELIAYMNRSRASYTSAYPNRSLGTSIVWV